MRMGAVNFQKPQLSFADACVVRMTENIADSKVFTLDEDFSVYRKLGRQMIPLIAPF